MNIAQSIERGSLFFPHKPALIFEEQVITYSQLNEQANRAANVLRTHKVQQGDRVALFLPNIPAFVVAYLGILKSGAIAVSVNVMLKRKEVRFILKDSGSRIVLTTTTLRNQIPEEELPQLEQVLIAEGTTTTANDWVALLASASSKAQIIALESDSPAAIVYTSGTTGFPKGAVLSHGNVITNVFAKVHYTGMSAEDRLLLFMPLFHCFGQNAMLNSAFQACATIVLQRRFVLDQVIKTVARERITMFFGVPTIYIRLLEACPALYDFSSIRYYFSAAAKMPEAVAKQWYHQFGLYIYEGYGLTETSPFACYNHDVRYKFGSVGTPITDVEIRAIDLEGNEVCSGESGELVIRGPNVMLGYWNNPEANSKAIRSGWFYSGDIGWIDAEGYVYITDRIKDMINICGFKVYPCEVERVLYEHVAIAEVAVYGIPDTEKGEQVKAAVRLKAGFTLDQEQLITFCKERMAIYKIPKVVEFVTKLPKNASGKILKRVLQEQVL